MLDLLDTIPAQVTITSLQDPKVRGVVLSAFVSGVSIESLATRLQINVAQLKRYFSLPAVKSELEQYFKESKSTETAENLLRGSLVDSVLVVVHLRDDPTAPARLRFDAAKYLISLNLGQTKTGLGEREEDFLASQVKAGHDRTHALRSDLARLLSTDAQALAALTSTRSGTQGANCADRADPLSVPALPGVELGG